MEYDATSSAVRDEKSINLRIATGYVFITDTKSQIFGKFNTQTSTQGDASLKVLFYFP